MLTLLLWLSVAVALALAAGWTFRRALVAVTPAGRTHTIQGMPVTAAFGMLVILLYVLVALMAPLLAPFPEREGQRAHLTSGAAGAGSTTSTARPRGG